MIKENKTNSSLNILTLTEVAKLFKVNEDYITKFFCKIKGFPYIRIGRRYFFEESLIKEWITQNKGSEFHSM